MYHLILNVLVFFLPLLHGDKSTASNPDIKEGNEAYTVSFYPEGGRLILNTACVVAFKAESRDGKTLDISGEIVDDRGNIVQNVKSLYNGLGYFNIYPNEGRTYYLNCKSTEGIEKSFILPAATLSIGIKVHFKEDQILVSALKPEHLQFKDTLYILLQSEDSIVYKDIWDFSRRWIVFEKKNIKTGLSSFLLVDSNGDLLSGRPFFKLENISSLQSLPPDFKIRLLPIMNDPGTDSIRKNLVLDTLAKTLTIDQEQSEPDKRPDDDIWKTIELENVEMYFRVALLKINIHTIFKIWVDICSDFDYTILNPNWRLNSMKQLGMRLRALREGIGLSQSKFADVIGSTQSSINRYENGQATPTVDLLRKYADYFDVSMDYIFARCDDPHGKLYEAKPPVDANNPELRKFVEMCFNPESPMNEKLKEAMLKMLGEAKI